MTEESEVGGVPAEVRSPTAVSPWTSPTAIKVGSRFGVWGLVGGLGLMTAATLGAPISLGAALAGMGVGVLASGIGTIVAAQAVLRRGRSLSGPVRAAAMAGVPLGVALAGLGVTSLLQGGPLVGIVQAITASAGALGALVIVLLVVGFFLGLSRREEIEE